MVWVHERDLELVRPGRKTKDDERLTAGVAPAPRRAIERDMEMPDGGDTSSAFGPNTGTSSRFSVR
jgi:hypothetical protein